MAEIVPRRQLKLSPVRNIPGYVPGIHLAGFTGQPTKPLPESESRPLHPMTICNAGSVVRE
jgi:hypothetical protein